MMRCARATSRRTTGLSIGASDVVGQISRRNQAADAVAHEQVVLEADEEPRLARIALAPGAPAQLEVHAPALVPVRADDVEAAERRHARRASRLVARRRGGCRCRGRPCWWQIVTAPSAPARATIAASSASFLAFSTSQSTPASRSRRGQPLRLRHGRRCRRAPGRPVACARRISSTTARSFASRCVNTTSGRSIAAHRAVRRDDDDVEAVELLQLRRPRRARCRSSRTGADSRAETAAASSTPRIRPSSRRARGPPWLRARPAGRRASGDPRRRGR